MPDLNVGAWLLALDLGLLGRLLLATVLGGLIGLERELSNKPAGLRTNLLICVGAALLMELSIEVAMMANETNAAQGVVFRADPARIAAQIVSGIGFLGAGTILQSRGNITGLTSAATIWVVAAIGMAVGAHAYTEAVGATILVYLALAVLSRVELAVIRRRGHHRYIVSIDRDPALAESIEQSFRSRGLRVGTSSLDKGPERFEASIDVSGPVHAHAKAVSSLIAQPGVHRVTRSG